MTQATDKADLTPSNTYGIGLGRALHRIADILSICAAIGVGLSLLRVRQLGWEMGALIILYILLSIAPSVVLRAPRYLRIRVALILLGYLQLLALPISHLGVAAGRLIFLPMLVAISAAIFDKVITIALFGLMTLYLVVVGYLFATGVFVSPQRTLLEWNAQPLNWVFVIVAVSVTTACLTILIYGFRRSWRQTSKEAQDKYDQFENMVEYAPNAITIFDLDLGRLVSVNAEAERLFGINREQLLDCGIARQLSPEMQPCGGFSRDLARSYIQQALDGENPEFRWTHKHASGETIPCEVSLIRIPPENKRLVRGSIRDISAHLKEQAHKEELQSKLAAAQRLEAIGQITGGVAHDFNNLLAIILGNLEILQSETPTARQRELLDPMIQATLRGANLTKSMLSFARRAPLDPVTVDMNSLVRETQNWIGRTMPTTIRIETSLLAGLWPVKADPGASENALINLILNARDAMPEGGELTLKTANIRIDNTCIESRQEDQEGLPPGRYVMVAVSDTGTGISDDIKTDIFVPFFTTKETGKGSGLGLSMVQGFMSQSGGTIQVYSEPGVGTTFKLYFPVAYSIDTTRPTKALLPEAVSGKRILLAEDEDDVRQVLTAMLQAEGYAVVSVPNGDAALANFEEDPNIDLLLTDIVMPGTLHGTALAKAIRAKSEIPVIFMSGYAGEATNGLRPNDIRLMKPVMRRDLLEAVSAAL